MLLNPDAVNKAGRELVYTGVKKVPRDYVKCLNKRKRAASLSPVSPFKVPYKHSLSSPTRVADDDEGICMGMEEIEVESSDVPASIKLETEDDSMVG